MSIVKLVIDSWDPVNLLSHAPSDEYHSEIKEIEIAASSTTNPAELAEKIYTIFLKSFDAVSFQKTHDECTQIARKILSGE